MNLFSVGCSNVNEAKIHYCDDAPSQDDKFRYMNLRNNSGYTYTTQSQSSRSQSSTQSSENNSPQRPASKVIRPRDIATVNSNNMSEMMGKRSLDLPSSNFEMIAKKVNRNQRLF